MGVKDQGGGDNNIMMETRVPMTLREQFLQDPFFSSSLSDMEKVREEFFQQSREMRERFEEQCRKSERRNSKEKGSMMSRDLMMPKRWMMPSMFDDNQDTNLISMKNDDTKMEISLNTTGYKPSELTVNVVDNEITIEGRHEEKSEAGHTMVSKQFSRRYTLPAEAKLAEVESNLSQDGVMVITVPKEKKIQEIKEKEKEKVVQKSSLSNEQTSEEVNQQ